MVQQSNAGCSLYSAWLHFPSTALSYSNSNFINDFQINDSSEGKQVHVAKDKIGGRTNAVNDRIDY